MSRVQQKGEWSKMAHTRFARPHSQILRCAYAVSPRETVHDTATVYQVEGAVREDEAEAHAALDEQSARLAARRRVGPHRGRAAEHLKPNTHDAHVRAHGIKQKKAVKHRSIETSEA